MKEQYHALYNLVIGSGIVGLLATRLMALYYDARKARDSAKRAHDRLDKLDERLRALEIKVAGYANIAEKE